MISLDDVASFEIGARPTGSFALVLGAYNHAKPRSFDTETTPEPLATLHLRDGSVVQLQFSTQFPRDCVLAYVGDRDQATGSFYTLEAPGLLAAVCQAAGLDGAQFEDAATALQAMAGVAEREATAQAEATLLAFFDAWQTKDLAAYEALLTDRRRQDMNLGDWTFSSHARVEFGPVTALPEVTERRMATYGYAYREGIAQEDVRCFRASITWYYKPGVIGTTDDGEELPWMWWVVRGADGEWGVDGWGA